jgi:hypothetical protein
VFDWEQGKLEGLPGWDRAYFDLQVGVVARGWQAERLTEEAVVLMTSDALDGCLPALRAPLVAAVLIRMALGHEAEGNRGPYQASVGALMHLLEAGRIVAQP